MSAGLYLGVAAAGAVGALARFVTDGVLGPRLPGRLPLATLVINVTGSLVLGLVTGAVLHLGAPADLQVVLGTGFCGGFTTFSTASLEAVRLAQQRRTALALVDAVGMLAACLLAAGIGLGVTGG